MNKANVLKLADFIEKSETVSVLRNFAETGKVDWVTPAKESVNI